MFVSSTRNQVSELLSEGWTAAAIADRLGLAGTTVSYHVERLRNPPPERHVRLVAVETVRDRVRTRERVAELLAQGLTRLEAARQLGLSKATVSYHARRLGLPVDERGARRYDWPAIQQYYDEGHSVRECVKAFGFSHETWNAAKKRGAILTRPQRTPNEELFVVGLPRNRANLKRRLLIEGLKPNSCAVCGITDWLGAPLSLAIHHINGDRRDNRVHNLELLCPNCHSQTDTYSGRNGHRRSPIEPLAHATDDNPPAATQMPGPSRRQPARPPGLQPRHGR
jgi:DNA-binding CsgD family transcriptional regulator/5-methylcytosine-specific restriction endonuclease McrA